jgi:hypothetical protein
MDGEQLADLTPSFSLQDDLKGCYRPGTDRAQRKVGGECYAANTV